MQSFSGGQRTRVLKNVLKAPFVKPPFSNKRGKSAEKSIDVGGVLLTFLIRYFTHLQKSLEPIEQNIRHKVIENS